MKYIAGQLHFNVVRTQYFQQYGLDMSRIIGNALLRNRKMHPDAGEQIDLIRVDKEGLEVTDAELMHRIKAINKFRTVPYKELHILACRNVDFGEDVEAMRAFLRDTLKLDLSHATEDELSAMQAYGLTGKVPEETLREDFPPLDRKKRSASPQSRYVVRLITLKILHPGSDSSPEKVTDTREFLRGAVIGKYLYRFI